jgi:hypothetical protein
VRSSAARVRAAARAARSGGMAASGAPPKLGVTDPISVAPPSALDIALSEELERELRAAGLYESTEEAVLREEARVCACVRGRAAPARLCREQGAWRVRLCARAAPRWSVRQRRPRTHVNARASACSHNQPCCLSLSRQVLGKLDALVKDWVRRVSASKGFTEPLLSEVRCGGAAAQPVCAARVGPVNPKHLGVCFAPVSRRAARR